MILTIHMPSSSNGGDLVRYGSPLPDDGQTPKTRNDGLEETKGIPLCTEDRLISNAINRNFDMRLPPAGPAKTIDRAYGRS